MNLNLTILGSSSATPTTTRHPSAQLVQAGRELILIDCGEGTQIQLFKNKIKFQRISRVLISHLHGDHYLGLIGLLCTMHLFGRTKPLEIYAHTELREIIELQLRVSDVSLNYPLNFYSLENDSKHVLFETNYVRVLSFPLTHRIPTCGFVVHLKEGERNIRKEFLEQFKGLHYDTIRQIKNGEDFTSDYGRFFSNEEITFRSSLPKSYAYCSDTLFNPEIVENFNAVDLLYHEATFLHDKASIAKEKYHSTALEAARIATLAGAKKLMIGHYSARYDNLQPLLDEARIEFPNTLLAEENMTIQIGE